MSLPLRHYQNDEIEGWKVLPKGGLKKMLDDQDFSKTPAFKRLWCVPCNKETQHHIFYQKKGEETIINEMQCSTCLLVKKIYWYDHIVSKVGLAVL